MVTKNWPPNKGASRRMVMDVTWITIFCCQFRIRGSNISFYPAIDWLKMGKVTNLSMKNLCWRHRLQPWGHSEKLLRWRPLVSHALPASPYWISHRGLNNTTWSPLCPDSFISSPVRIWCYFSMQYHVKALNTLQYHATPFNAIQYNAISCTMQYYASQYDKFEYHAIYILRCNTITV